jgi:para-aminobenzoate synthetase component 1
MDVVRKLSPLPRLAFLDSAMTDPQLGRYSYVAADPFAEFRVRDGRAFWNGRMLADAPLVALDRLLAQMPSQARADLPPFQGGAIGTFAYEFNRVLERVPSPDHAFEGLDQACLHFYDTIVSFDLFAKRAWIVSTGRPEIEREAMSRRAEARTTIFRRSIEGPTPLRAFSNVKPLGWSSNFDAETYAAAVTRVVDYIRAGDVFEANIAQRFSARLPADFDPLAFYDRLRRRNPAPFAAYLDIGNAVVASSSPERFLRVSERNVEARPIKGTAKRFADPDADVASAQGLLASEKDRAENVMIVDLMRNDLSRVCLDDSIDVPVLCGLETYASVHHLVSVVVGRLAPGRTLGDLLAASFPGGSVTGAPKVRAMEIIAEIERHARGIFCGSIGWLGFDGAMDLNIGIRTAVLSNGEAVVHAGGAVTLASDPAEEYQETLLKAQRVLDAFASADGDLA